MTNTKEDMGKVEVADTDMGKVEVAEKAAAEKAANLVDMKVLTYSDIIAVEDIGAPVKEEVPEWGGAVLIRKMSGRERDKFEEQCVRQTRSKASNLTGLKCWLLSKCLVDVEGKKLFTKPVDIDQLNKKNGEVVDRLYMRAQEINGIGKKGEDAAEKNLPSDPSDSTGSDSLDS